MYSAIMSKEEKAERIGRLVAEYSDLKEQIGLWEDELKKAGRELESLHLFLRRADPERVLSTLKQVDFEQLKQTATRLAAAKERFDEIKSTLKTLNVNV